MPSNVLNIGLDAKRALANRTGLGEYSRLLIDGLSQLGVKLELFSPVTQSATAWNCPAPIHSSTKLFWRSFGISKAIRASGSQLYHGLSNELPFTAHRLTIPTVATIHDVLFKRFPADYPLFDRRIYHQKTAYAAKHAHAIIAPSRQTKKDLLAHYPAARGKIAVIPGCCHPSFFKEPETQALKKMQHRVAEIGSFLLCVGGFTKRKNQAVVLEAMHRLPKEERHALVFVGRGGSEEKNIIELAKRYHLKLHILNDVNRAELRALYALALAAVYPSHFEGFGIPVVEAMAAKCPIISSNTSSMQEVGGPHCLWFSPKKPQELAEQIKQIEAKRQDHALEENQAFAKNFGYIPMAERTLALYKQVIENGKK